MPNLFKIFIAYAREDEEFLSQLRKHFKPLEISNQAQIWYDGKILPGEDWEEAIKINIQNADLILLLISSDSIASDYFFNTEVKKALKRRIEGNVSVVPFILRPCQWQSTPLGKLQALPKNAKPITSWTNRDEAYEDATQKIAELIENYGAKEEIKELKNQILLLEREALEMEIKILRAQMNPHFLFNSMNSIKALILNSEVQKAADYLTKFSLMLRSILTNSEKQKIRLADEINSVRLYIELESVRLTDYFNYGIYIDSNIDANLVRVPPFILQPFVENAIWWGLLPKKSGIKKLNINIIRNGDFLFFEIEDNGVGIKKVYDEKRKSYGIDLIRKRIQMLHEENYLEIIYLQDHNHKAIGIKVIVNLYAPE